MRKYIIFSVAFFLLLPISSGSTLEKEGKYSSKFGWYSKGQTFEVGPDHVFFVGEFSGTNFNDKGKGFMDKVSVVCPGVMDNNRDAPHAHGHCVVTDDDGDKAYLVWKCTGAKLCKGDFQWTGGTGKYEGISGNNSFYAGVGIGGTTQGYSIWAGEWKLP
jgi:hypothetical protein